MMELFQKIIDKEEKYNDSVIKISRKNLEKCLEYFNKYLPNSYYDLQYITGIKEEIKMHIKEYEMSNY